MMLGSLQLPVIPQIQLQLQASGHSGPSPTRPAETPLLALPTPGDLEQWAWEKVRGGRRGRRENGPGVVGPENSPPAPRPPVQTSLPFPPQAGSPEHPADAGRLCLPALLFCPFTEHVSPGLPVCPSLFLTHIMHSFKLEIFDLIFGLVWDLAQRWRYTPNPSGRKQSKEARQETSVEGQARAGHGYPGPSLQI